MRLSEFSSPKQYSRKQYSALFLETSVSRPETRNWKHGHCNEIGIDFKYLHKMVPSWNRQWHFHAKESCYSSSSSPDEFLKTFCTWPENWIQDWPEDSNKLGLKYSRKHIWTLLEIFENTFFCDFEWLKVFRLCNLKIYRLWHLVENKDLGAPRFNISVQNRNWSDSWFLCFWQLLPAEFSAEGS